jgi:hypothetical protein
MHTTFLTGLVVFETIHRWVSRQFVVFRTVTIGRLLSHLVSTYLDLHEGNSANMVETLSACQKSYYRIIVGVHDRQKIQDSMPRTIRLSHFFTELAAKML